MTKNQWLDLLERAGWTVAQALVGLGITEATDIKAWWAAPIAMALSSAKTWITHKLSGKARAGAAPTTEAP